MTMNLFWPLIKEPIKQPRRAYVPIDQSILFQLLHPPESMEVVGVSYNYQTLTVNFIVEHPDILPVAQGEPLRALIPIFTSYQQLSGERIEATWDLPNRSAKPADRKATPNRKGQDVAQTDDD